MEVIVCKAHDCAKNPRGILELMNNKKFLTPYITTSSNRKLCAVGKFFHAYRLLVLTCLLVPFLIVPDVTEAVLFKQTTDWFRVNH